MIFLWAFGLALAQRTSWRSQRTWLLAVATCLSAIGSRVDACIRRAVVIVVFVLTGWTKARASWISFVVLLVLATIGLSSSPRSVPREAASVAAWVAPNPVRDCS